MRVAVRHPSRVEIDAEGNEVEVPESISAYRFGRIEDFVHPVTGAVTPAEQLAAALVEEAQREFPGQDVFIERLVHNGDGPPEDPHGEGGTSTWVHHEEVPEGAVSPKGGRIVTPEPLHAEQAQSAGGES